MHIAGKRAGHSKPALEGTVVRNGGATVTFSSTFCVDDVSIRYCASVWEKATCRRSQNLRRSMKEVSLAAKTREAWKELFVTLNNGACV